MECDPETWKRAQFATKSDEETRNYLAAVFERDLAGHQLSVEQFEVDQLRPREKRELVFRKPGVAW